MCVHAYVHTLMGEYVCESLCMCVCVYVCVCVGMDECAKNGRNKERKMKRDILKE